jgi:hypothetical protein
LGSLLVTPTWQATGVGDRSLSVGNYAEVIGQADGLFDRALISGPPEGILILRKLVDPKFETVLSWVFKRILL